MKRSLTTSDRMSRHVLVIDDDPAILSFLDIVLRDHGCSVSCAGDGQQALDLLATGTLGVDLVLSDIRMPGMDGLALLDALGKTHPRLPVVLMTGHAALDVSLRAIRSGAMDLVLKPITGGEIRRILSRLDMLQARNLNDTERADPLFAETLSFRIPSQRALVHKAALRIHHHFADDLNGQGISPEQIRVCLVEALENALVHGNLEIDSAVKEEDWGRFEALVSERQADPAYGRRSIAISASLGPEGFAAQIEDQGQGFDPDQPAESADPGFLSASGRGLLLIRGIMDEVRWKNGGRCICMLKRGLTPGG